MLSTVLTQALNSQFTHERENHVLYQAISDSLDAANWPGTARWFAVQAAEEAGHARKIAGYLIAQQPYPAEGSPVVYEALAAPEQAAVNGPESAFMAAYAREQLTTSRIAQLYHLADLDESPATHEFLLWFVREQVEEEHALVDILQELSRATGPAAMLILDREYGKR